jgi:AIG2 family protein
MENELDTWSKTVSEKNKVWVFFYGSYINLNVLKEVDIFPESIDTAKLSGYDIVIQPRANLVPSFEHTVFGILTTASHSELQRLYTDHALGVLGELYLPEAVVVQTLDGSLQPALCYIASTMKAKPAENDYIDRIVNPAKEYSFPKNYIKHLESFRPHSST